jgi:hypothetical protein
MKVQYLLKILQQPELIYKSKIPTSAVFYTLPAGLDPPRKAAAVDFVELAIQIARFTPFSVLPTHNS